MADTTAFITLENISKQFPGVLALDNVNLTLRKGEVHCLAGQNGCGKSTIIKVISGVYHPEKGAQILLDGKLFHHLTPQLSSHYGIQVIYQDLSLFPNFSVAENIAVNRYLPGGDIWVRRGAMKQQALCASSARVTRLAIAGNMQRSGMRHNSLFLTESDLLPTNPATTNVNCRAIKGCGCLFLLHCRNGLWWLVIVNMIGNTQQDHGDGENNPTC